MSTDAQTGVQRNQMERQRERVVQYDFRKRYPSGQTRAAHFPLGFCELFVAFAQVTQHIAQELRNLCKHGKIVIVCS